VVTAVVSLLAVRTSAIPADANHPYGHGKVECFLAVVVGVLIGVATLLILNESYHGFRDPKALNAAPEGLLVNGLASVVNGAWCWVLIHRGRRLRSPALVADGHHLLTDVVSSVGVLLGVGLATVTGWAVLDPALAALVALYVLWSGWQLMRESAGGLMDAAVPEVLLTRIRDLISSNADGALEAHDLRTRQSGPMTFVEFHLVVPRDMPVSTAHDSETGLSAPSARRSSPPTSPSTSSPRTKPSTQGSWSSSSQVSPSGARSSARSRRPLLRGWRPGGSADRRARSARSRCARSTHPGKGP
jgi:cation diffusion facilitator family transporter